MQRFLGRHRAGRGLRRHSSTTWSAIPVRSEHGVPTTEESRFRSAIFLPATLHAMDSAMKRRQRLALVLPGLLACLFALTYSTNPAGTMGQRSTGIGPSFKGPIGLQLYSLREQFAKDVPGTLDQV